VNKFRWNFAESFNIRAPVVDAKKLRWNCPEHPRNLFGLHGGVSAKSGQDCSYRVTIMLPCVARQVAGTRVYAAVIRRDDEHAIAWPELRQATLKQILQLRKQIVFDSADGAIETHAANSTFFKPGASR
jgi:hypothetical protein